MSRLQSNKDTELQPNIIYCKALSKLIPIRDFTAELDTVTNNNKPSDNLKGKEVALNLEGNGNSGHSHYYLETSLVKQCVKPLLIKKDSKASSLKIKTKQAEIVSI